MSHFLGSKGKGQALVGISEVVHPSSESVAVSFLDLSYTATDPDATVGFVTGGGHRDADDGLLAIEQKSQSLSGIEGHGPTWGSLGERFT